MKSFAKPALHFILEIAMCQNFCAIIHQLAAITSDKELLKKLISKYCFGNLLQLHFINKYLRKSACKMLLWKKLPGNFVPMFPCLCTPGQIISSWCFHLTISYPQQSQTHRVFRWERANIHLPNYACLSFKRKLCIAVRPK